MSEQSTDLNLKRLKEIALKFLARREHSQKELQLKLQKKRFSLQQISTILKSLSDEGWQSDDRFAECYIRFRINAGFGPLRIAFELSQRGVQQLVIEKYLKQDNRQFWMRQITHVYTKRFKSAKSSRIDPKHYRFLQQRGFPHDCIMQFLRGNNDEYA